MLSLLLWQSQVELSDIDFSGLNTTPEIPSCLECLKITNETPGNYKGIQNEGNMCWRNSIFQVLFKPVDHFYTQYTLFSHWKLSRVQNFEHVCALFLFSCWLLLDHLFSYWWRKTKTQHHCKGSCAVFYCSSSSVTTLPELWLCLLNLTQYGKTNLHTESNMMQKSFWYSC